MTQWSCPLPFNQCFPACIPACMLLSLSSYWVYHAKAPSQCVSNYMFLLEAPVSCVASPFVSVAKLGPGEHPQSRTPATPTAQEYHYHPGPGLWQTAVTLGMTRAHLSDLCVWVTLLWQQVAFPSTSLVHSNEECVRPGSSAIQNHLIRAGRVCLGILGQWWTFPQSHISMETDGGTWVPKEPWHWKPTKGQMLEPQGLNRKLAGLKKHTHTHTYTHVHTHTHHSHFIPVCYFWLTRWF